MASTVASSLLRAGRTQNKLASHAAIRSVYTQVGTTAARTANLATSAAKNGMRKPRVGVAGATGAVGIEMRKKLEERGFPMESLKLFAHPSEEGTPITFAGKEYKCESVSHSPFTLTLTFHPHPHRSPLTAHRSPLTAHHSPLALHRPPHQVRERLRRLLRRPRHLPLLGGRRLQQGNTKRI